MNKVNGIVVFNMDEIVVTERYIQTTINVTRRKTNNTNNKYVYYRNMNLILSFRFLINQINENCVLRNIVWHIQNSKYHLIFLNFDWLGVCLTPLQYKRLYCGDNFLSKNTWWPKYILFYVASTWFPIKTVFSVTESRKSRWMLLIRSYHWRK